MHLTNRSLHHQSCNVCLKTPIPQHNTVTSLSPCHSIHDPSLQCLCHYSLHTCPTQITIIFASPLTASFTKSCSSVLCTKSLMQRCIGMFLKQVCSVAAFQFYRSGLCCSTKPVAFFVRRHSISLLAVAT